MKDLNTIIRVNNERQHVYEQFKNALSLYGDALKRGDAFGEAFEALVRATQRYQHSYGDKQAAVRLQGQLQCARSPIVAPPHPAFEGWDGTDVGEQAVGQEHYRSTNLPEVVIGSRCGVKA